MKNDEEIKTILECKMNGYGIPPHMWSGVVRWVLDAVPPGRFLREVLSNSLVGAFVAADKSNRQVLHRWAEFIWNELPSGCWGSHEKLITWKGLRKITADQRVADGQRKEEP